MVSHRFAKNANGWGTGQVEIWVPSLNAKNANGWGTGRLRIRVSHPFARTRMDGARGRLRILVPSLNAKNAFRMGTGQVRIWVPSLNAKNAFRMGTGQVEDFGSHPFAKNANGWGTGQVEDYGFPPIRKEHEWMGHGQVEDYGSTLNAKNAFRMGTQLDEFWSPRSENPDLEHPGFGWKVWAWMKYLTEFRDGEWRSAWRARFTPLRRAVEDHGGLRGQTTRSSRTASTRCCRRAWR